MNVLANTYGNLEARCEIAVPLQSVGLRVNSYVVVVNGEQPTLGQEMH